LAERRNALNEVCTKQRLAWDSDYLKFDVSLMIGFSEYRKNFLQSVVTIIIIVWSPLELDNVTRKGFVQRNEV
jgi:hypothetical protein